MKHNKAWLAAVPMYLFTIFFVAVPLVYVLVLSFLTRDASWGVTNELTLSNYAKILEPAYAKTFLTSLQVALLTTVLTALIGYPFGYFMAKLQPNIRNKVMLLVIVPFWTNALVRIYGWIILLRSQGVLSALLQSLGLTSEPIGILYTLPAVLIGTVYALLPFMILSVYSSCLKLDPSLTEAARDLGASPWKAFWTVSFKLTLPGLLSGFVFVFVPSIGLFFIADLLGGGKLMLIGNLIKNQLTTARNWPFGAALSVVMMIMTLLIIGIYRRLAKGKDLEGLI